MPALVHREPDHNRGGQIPHDAFGGFHTVHAGHVDVHHDHVGFQRRGQGDCLLAIGGLADYFKIGTITEHARKTVSDQRMIIHEEHVRPGRSVGQTPADARRN